MPEQKGAETDAVFGLDSTSEGDAVPESTTGMKTKAVPETVAANSAGSVVPEEALAVGSPVVAPEEANIKSQSEAAGPVSLGVKGLPTGGTGAAGKLSLAMGLCLQVLDCM